MFDDLNTPDDIKIELMKKWITESNNVHLAWTGFNCAIRLINWLKILQDISTENMQEDSWEIIQRSMYLQHRFNLSNIEHHIPGNHVLIQYYSAWLITEIFSDWKTNTGSEHSLQKLLEEFDTEFLDSGLHFELSTHYHLQISLVGIYLIGHLKNLNREVPERLMSTMSKASAVIDNFLIGNYYPLIGDGCYIFFHESYNEDFLNFRHLRDNYLSTESGDAISNYDGQYIIIKKNDFHLIFDTGEIGLKQNPGHGHADLLSLVAGYKDTPIFIDPGTFQYNNKVESLELKRTSYHNTVTLNGEDQAKLWGFFRWAYLPSNIHSNVIAADDGVVRIEGGYFGYRHAGGVHHERTIEINEEKLIIKDNLKGGSLRSVQINFILHPDLKIERKADHFILSTGKNNFELRSNSTELRAVEDNILIYESYNEPTRSKRIIFYSDGFTADEFASEVLLKPIS